jgi:hypothetical protein
MMDAPTWDQALDALEQHLLDAEALVRGDIEEMPADTWVKPYGLGPMPPRLVDRALALRERQAAVLAAIPEVLTENRRKRQLAERLEMRTGRHQSDSVYVDVSA